MSDSITNPYESDYDFLHFGDPNEGDLPSVKFGPEVFVGVFALLILLSGLIVVLVITCSRMQEKWASNKKADKSQQQQKDLKSNLTCKPWCPEGSQPVMQDATEKTVLQHCESDYSTSTSDSDSSSSSGDEDCGDMVDVDLEMQNASENCNGAGDVEKQHRSSAQSQQKDGSCCGICSKEYQPGQPVYESNNPQCQHQFHKVCMDKWLDYQNSCPICNQPFVLCTV